MPPHAELQAGAFCSAICKFGCRNGVSFFRLALLSLLPTLIAGCLGCSKTPSTSATTEAVKIDAGQAPLPYVAPIRPDNRTTALHPQFREVSAEAGIDFLRYDDQTGLHRMMEVLGAGTALFDFDGDGRIDVFFTNGCRLPLTLHDQSHDLALFRNRGQMQFESTVEGSGLRAWHGYFSGCTVGDYNSDGFDDLFLAAYGPDLFLRNNGDGTFSDVTRETGAGSDLWGSSAAFADVNRDGHLDLIVINYVLATDDRQDLCPNSESPDGYIQCAPSVFAAAPDFLFLGDGAGAFIDATTAAGLTAPDGKGLGVLVFDMDRDGDDDIFIANDGTPNFFYRNIGSESTGSVTIPRFEECGLLLGCALTLDGRPLAGMGVASGDFDGDGWRDLAVTNFYADTTVFYRNLHGECFADDTRVVGLGPRTRDKVGFGAEFLEFDNDGRLDLAITNGHIDDFRWQKSPEPYRMTPQLFANDGERFVDVSAEAGPFFQSHWIGRALAVGDLDGDGKQDLVITHQIDRSAVLRNETATTNGSVTLRLVGTGNSNRSAFGAIVEAEGLGRITVREVVGGGSFQSASDRRLHFGLGDRDRISTMRIVWPSGRAETWQDVAAGEYIAREDRPLLRQIGGPRLTTSVADAPILRASEP
jgi:hypothetical protein